MEYRDLDNKSEVCVLYNSLQHENLALNNVM